MATLESMTAEAPGQSSMTESPSRSGGPQGNIADVAIIGAGPYGLSLAAHLAAKGVRFRIFGRPMSVWSTQMPKGMRLKSEGFASSLSDPEGKFTLAWYCRERGIAYADTGKPVELETFISYGLEFQKRCVPNLEEKLVVSLARCPAGFELELEDGERLRARRVVVAVGITHYGYIPPVLAALPEGLVSHSSEHRDLEGLKGSQIAVVGAGASAIDLAALLNEAGAQVQIVARDSVIRFHDPPAPRSRVNRILHPLTGLGVGKQLLFYVKVPHLFRHFPVEFRLDRLRKTLGPAPGWFVKDQIVGKVPMLLNVKISGASAANGKARLHLVDGQGQPHTVEADHVIAATGYKPDLDRLRFLSHELKESLATIEKGPALSGKFESSVQGLYFVGPSATYTFGPLMRFAYGSHYTARRLSKHLATTAPRPVY